MTEDHADKPLLIVVLSRLLAKRYEKRAKRCRERAKELTEQADKFEEIQNAFYSTRGSGTRPSARVYLAELWCTVAMYREYTDQLQASAKNTLPFKEWLRLVWEHRDDPFGYAAEDLHKLLDGEDPQTFTELAMFLRDRRVKTSLRECAQKLFAMWVCWKHDIGINPTPEFFEVDEYKWRQWVPETKVKVKSWL